VRLLLLQHLVLSCGRGNLSALVFAFFSLHLTVPTGGPLMITVDIAAQFLSDDQYVNADSLPSWQVS
jgi:hypothetical protein